MPKFSKMMEGKFLKKEDCDPAILVTIEKFQQENVAMANEPEEKKWVAYFVEIERGLVLNSTNLQLLQLATGCDDTDQVIGKKIVLFVDHTVSMGGKLVGGVRVRAPKGKAAPAPAPVAPPVAEAGDSNEPF